MKKFCQFEMNAKKYFSVDAERFSKAREDDIVLVTLDFLKKKASFVWHGKGDNPANFPAEEDDFSSVKEIWEKSGVPCEVYIRLEKDDIKERLGEVSGRGFYSSILEEALDILDDEFSWENFEIVRMKDNDSMVTFVVNLELLERRVLAYIKIDKETTELEIEVQL